MERDRVGHGFDAQPVVQPGAEGLVGTDRARAVAAFRAQGDKGAHGVLAPGVCVEDALRETRCCDCVVAASRFDDECGERVNEYRAEPVAPRSQPLVVEFPQQVAGVQFDRSGTALRGCYLPFELADVDPRVAAAAPAYGAGVGEYSRRIAPPQCYGDVVEVAAEIRARVLFGFIGPEREGDFVAT
jgi:hypothetical protein